MTKGIIYYSDCRGETLVLEACRAQLLRAAGPLPLVSCTLEPLAFGDNRHLAAPRGYLTMFRQILMALEAQTVDVIFHAEHDVLYSASHFLFEPPRDDIFYYNQHTWRVDRASGRTLFYYCNQVSGLCAARPLLLAHYRQLVAHVAAHGFDRALGFEPGTNRRQRTIGLTGGVARWFSDHPNVDIKTEWCLTKGRWSRDQFRNPATCEGWIDGQGLVPGWGRTGGRMEAFLAGLLPVPRRVA